MIRDVVRSEAIRRIRAHLGELRALAVSSISIFGSVARDQATPDSDIDILVEFDGPIGYFHLFRVRQRLQEILGIRVDLATPASIRPELRDSILTEAVRAA